ncbi:hypothetical protein DMW53_14995 [Serratia marcescens]|uniref:siphovirus Gp157 family protein n=1 Tax=Serratia marcescens TaxID=615 RepID=UPI000D95B5FF|nr:siphovirus Gp157 family protein [Serratia marcescens]PYA59356.1 hypothetical protein DMW53_14995 [Serratia marcescens]PYB17794.1 hypothetical protein DMW55_13710 [Serratia marcescens]
MSDRTIDIAAEIFKLESLVSESGELTTEMIADTVEGLEGMMEDKFDATMLVIRDFETKSEACKKEAARMAERKKHWERQAYALKKYLLECLLISGRKNFKTTLNSFTAAKGRASLVIDDVNLLPDEFVESHTEVIDDVQNDKIKKVLMEALKKVEEMKEKGEAPPPELLNPIPGAHLEIGATTLQVR